MSPTAATATTMGVSDSVAGGSAVWRGLRGRATDLMVMLVMASRSRSWLATATTSSPSIVLRRTGSGTQLLVVLKVGRTRYQGSMLPEAPANSGATILSAKYFSTNWAASPWMSPLMMRLRVPSEVLWVGKSKKRPASSLLVLLVLLRRVSLRTWTSRSMG